MALVVFRHVYKMSACEVESLVWWERELLLHAGKQILQGEQSEEDRIEDAILRAE